MKTILVLTISLVSLFTSGQTSVYHPFPDSNGVWNFHYSWHCFANGTGNQNYSIVISGDTVINGQSYHKLSTPFVETFSIGNCGGVGTGYKGAIRDNSLTKIVYYFAPADTSEKLLYDFNMQVGDTVRGYTQRFTFTPDVVQSIDSVLVGSTYRKRWIINTCYNLNFIEGIGSTYGLFERSPGCIIDDMDFSLLCFKQNDQALFPDTTADCNLITSIDLISEISNQINVFPNPSHGSITIDFGNLNFNNFKLTDISGNNLVHQSSSNKNIIQIDNLACGIYILNVTNNLNRVMIKKIVICP